MSETHLPALTKLVLKVRYNGEKKDNIASIITIWSDQSCLIKGGPALIDIQDKNLCYIEIENCSSCNIKLERGLTIDTVEHEWEDQVQEFEGKQIDNFISKICETASLIQKPVYLTRDKIEKRVKMNIPDTHKDQYLDLLYKYCSVISKDKSDLGMAKNFFHRIVLKDDGPVYPKQYQIPEAHNQFMEET